MGEIGQISENSKRVARNTIALYIRMFFLMLVSLLTARFVLNALGAQDRGVYEAVASFVSMMALLSNAFSSAISRFLTVEIAHENKEALGKVFSTANGLLLCICVGILIIAEPFGIWYIDNVMNLPEGRTEVAQWLFQFSLLTFIINLLSIPYNACIFAHERMGVYAVIGVIEGILKLGVAIAIMYSPFDRLILYGILMMAVALIARTLYAAYCRRHFPESRAGMRLERTYTRQMFNFAGWNGLAQGIYILNYQGATQLLNYFFGVVFNTMRGLALNVENMIKQFIANVIVAINPQIIKSYTAGDRAYSAQLVCKGCKYAFLIGFVLALPFFFEAETILYWWLGHNEVPEGTALFTRLGLVCLLLDISLNPFSTYIQASGKLKPFYFMYVCVTILIFPLTWVLYKFGFAASSLYFVFIADYILLDFLKIVICSKVYEFSAKLFLQETLFKVIPVVLFSAAVNSVIYWILPAGAWRTVSIIALGTLAVACFSYIFAFTPGERAYLLSKIKR